MRSFYRRRCARILPVYFAVVVLAFGAQALTAGQPWMDRLLPAWVYATFTTNFALAHLGKTGLLLNPTWSLAVEEQFYLAMPFVIMLTRKPLLPWVLAALCAVAIGLRALWASDIAATEVLLPCRMDALLIGVAAALAHRSFDLSRHAVALLAAALAPVIVYLLLILALQRGAAPFTHTAYALATACSCSPWSTGCPRAAACAPAGCASSARSPMGSI
ncbi:MAG: acyltransferase family protein [Rhizomicrobium sp.]